MIKKFLNLSIICMTLIAGFNANADIKPPVNINVEYVAQPELGKPVKIAISAKPLINGELLEIQLVIPNGKIKSITNTHKRFDGPLKDKIYSLPIELNVPDGKAYQIIAFVYLTSNGQKYSNSHVMNIDLGEPEKPQYPIINRYAPDGTLIIGVVGVQIESQEKIKR